MAIGQDDFGQVRPHRLRRHEVRVPKAEKMLGKGFLALDAATALHGLDRMEAAVAEHVHDLDRRNLAIAGRHPLPGARSEHRRGEVAELIVGEHLHGSFSVIRKRDSGSRSLAAIAVHEGKDLMLG